MNAFRVAVRRVDASRTQVSFVALHVLVAGQPTSQTNRGNREAALFEERFGLGFRV